jgi:hypothetical protein
MIVDNGKGAVFEHFAGHDAEIMPIERGSSATFFLGEVSIQARPSNVVMSVKADDETGLAYILPI